MASKDTTSSEVERDPSGRYVRFNEVLGQGAFKTVYKAFDEAAGLEVAWNILNIEDVLHQDPDKLYAEVSLLKSLKHDNIIKLYDFWVNEEKKTINMITELFTSGSLRHYRKKHKNVEMKAIKNWARQILRGLNYLHSHDPPIIHRDLKCENIFVNGNTGEVKIGDLGLAIAVGQATTCSAAGTPAFMAPELYDEDYNELVDVYSFGMCLLEMVTREFPYGECRNSAQIYKKVISGVKPESLGRVSDPKVKGFIEKCLVPVGLRLPAAELLNDPFLSIDQSPKPLSCDLHLPSLMSLASKSSSQSNAVRVSSAGSSQQTLIRVSAGSSHQTLPSYSSEELKRSSPNYVLRLSGRKVDSNHICFTLRAVKVPVIGDGDEVQKIVFPFYLDSDTSTSIAEEMVEKLELSEEDVLVVAEMIDSLVSRIHVVAQRTNGSSHQTLPSYSSEELKRCSDNYVLRLSGRNVDNNHICFTLRAAKVPLSDGDKVQKIVFPFYLDLDTSTSIAEEMIEKLDFSKEDVSVVAQMIDSLIQRMRSGASMKCSYDASYKQNKALPQLAKVRAQDSVESIMSNLSAKHGIIAGSSRMIKECSRNRDQVLSCDIGLGKFDEEFESVDELNMEIECIDAQYSQCIDELRRMNKEAVENVKRRWMTQKSSLARMISTRC